MRDNKKKIKLNNFQTKHLERRKTPVFNFRIYGQIYDDLLEFQKVSLWYV